MPSSEQKGRLGTQAGNGTTESGSGDFNCIQRPEGISPRLGWMGRVALQNECFLTENATSFVPARTHCALTRSQWNARIGRRWNPVMGKFRAVGSSKPRPTPWIPIRCPRTHSSPEVRRAKVSEMHFSLGHLHKSKLAIPFETVEK